MGQGAELIIQGIYERRMAASRLNEVAIKVKNGDLPHYELVKELRRFYPLINKYIYKQEGFRRFCHFMPYLVDWKSILNGIEYSAWVQIRSLTYLPLYPQYPVLNYVLDFGAPHVKVGFEIDGKNFHNKQKDFIRDLELQKDGLVIYRVSGSEMMRKKYKDANAILNEMYNDYQDEYLSELNKSEMENYFMNTGVGVLDAIKIKYFGSLDGLNPNCKDYLEMLTEKTLKIHCLQPELNYCI